MTEATSPVHAVTPHLVCADAARAIDFYIRAFGATELIRLDTDEGAILHACLSINGSSVMLMEENKAWGAVGPLALGNTPVTIHLSVDDADAWMARAAEAGATVLMPVTEMFWGDRYGVLKDPFGHSWAVATPVRSVSLDDLRAGARALTGDCPGAASQAEAPQ